jgi:hypothetical protein
MEAKELPTATGGEEACKATSPARGLVSLWTALAAASAYEAGTRTALRGVCRERADGGGGRCASHRKRVSGRPRQLGKSAQLVQELSQQGDGEGTMQQEKLKSCPFCGNPPQRYPYECGIACIQVDCDVQPATAGHETIEEAEDAWNHRQPEIDEANYAREEEERAHLRYATMGPRG